MRRNTFAKQARDQQRGWLHSRKDEVLLDRQLRDSLRGRPISDLAMMPPA